MENKISRKKNPPTKKEIELANKLRTKRLENNLSLQEVADKLGISKVTVSRYETLDITNIPSDKIEGMAKLYKTTPAYLMGWEEDKKEEEVKTAARNEKTFNKSFNKYSKLDPKKKKIVDDLINNLFDEMEDIEEEDIDVLK